MKMVIWGSIMSLKKVAYPIYREEPKKYCQISLLGSTKICLNS